MESNKCNEIPPQRLLMWGGGVSVNEWYGIIIMVALCVLIGTVSLVSNVANERQVYQSKRVYHLRY